MKGTPEPEDGQWPLGEPIRKESGSADEWLPHPENKLLEVNRKTGQMRTKIPTPVQWWHP